MTRRSDTKYRYTKYCLVRQAPVLEYASPVWSSSVVTDHCSIQWHWTCAQKGLSSHPWWVWLLPRCFGSPPSWFSPLTTRRSSPFFCTWPSHVSSPSWLSSKVPTITVWKAVTQLTSSPWTKMQDHQILQF